MKKLRTDSLRDALLAAQRICNAVAWRNQGAEIPTQYLMRTMDTLQQQFAAAQQAFLALAKGKAPGAMSAQEKAEIDAFFESMTGSRVEGVADRFAAGRAAGQAVVVEYATNVFPQFQGRTQTFNPSTGLHSTVTIALADIADLRARMGDLDTALSPFVAS